ncbi:hypothetical protein [Helicobacter rodentium]|nr:hypothetical protein [Helicobacter rodentium]
MLRICTPRKAKAFLAMTYCHRVIANEVKQSIIQNLAYYSTTLNF